MTGMFAHTTASPQNAARRYTGTRAIPVPPDFTRHARTSKNADLCQRYGVSEFTVRKWRKQTRTPSTVKAPPPKPRKPMPTFPDFLAQVKRMNTVQLARHYGVGKDTIRRMCSREGVTPAEIRTPRKPEPKPIERRKPRRVNYSGPQAPRIPPRDTTLEGEAAQFLRANTFVFRCREGGAADQSGAFWRYGNVVLTPGEMIARAARHGFDPDAWQVVDRGSLAPAGDRLSEHVNSIHCDEAFFDCGKSFGYHAQPGA